jgi:hypothetical protein
MADKGWPFREPEIFEAIDGNRVPCPPGFVQGGGAWGCLQSHRQVLERAIHDGVNRLLVLEDDLCMRPGFVADVERFLREVPEDWDQLMLGGQHCSPAKPAKPGIVRCGGPQGCQRTHAYAIRGKFLRDLYAHWCRPGEAGHCDWSMGPLQERYKVYAPDPFVFGQDRSHSDIAGGMQAKRFWLAASGKEPLLLLRCSREIVVSLRSRGIHTGHSRDPRTDIDVGLAKIFMAPGAPPAAYYAGLKSWLWELQGECASDETLTLGVWHPDANITMEMLQASWGGPIAEIVAATADEAWIKTQAFLSRVKTNGPVPDAPAPSRINPLKIFYHIACMSNWQEVVGEQVRLLAHVGLKHVTACVLGNEGQAAWCKTQANKAGIILDIAARTNDLAQYEHPTLCLIHEWATKCTDNAAALYLHTKGVGTPDCKHKKHWRRVMQRHVVADWRENLGRLQMLDAVGVDWVDGEMPHFSGNFWMARRDWLARLPNPKDWLHRRDPDKHTVGGHPWRRMHAEFWIGAAQYPRVESFCGRNLTLWQGPDVFKMPIAVDGFSYGD